MRSPQNWLIILLSLTTLVAGSIAWRQYQELIQLRPLTIAPPQLTLAPTTVAAAQEEVPAAEPIPESSEAAPTERSNVEPSSRRQGRPNRNQAAETFMAAMDRPDVQRLQALQRKAELDGRYAALFRDLRLTPDELDAFKNLLVDRNTAVMDVRAAAREQGISPRTDRETYAKLVGDAQAEIDQNIRQQLGEPAYAKYKEYEKTLPQRTVVEQLEQRLSYSTTPLTPAQSSQLIQLLANSGATVAQPGFPRMGGNQRNQAIVTDTALNHALGMLAAPQLDALRQIQQEQQLQAQINAAVRPQPNAQSNNTGSAKTPPPSPPGGG